MRISHLLRTSGRVLSVQDVVLMRPKDGSGCVLKRPMRARDISKDIYVCVSNHTHILGFDLGLLVSSQKKRRGSAGVGKKN